MAPWCLELLAALGFTSVTKYLDAPFNVCQPNKQHFNYEICLADRKMPRWNIHATVGALSASEKDSIAKQVTEPAFRDEHFREYHFLSHGCCLQKHALMMDHSLMRVEACYIVVCKDTYLGMGAPSYLTQCDNRGGVEGSGRCRPKSRGTYGDFCTHWTVKHTITNEGACIW
jgi:hypothetical protein